MLRLIGLAWVGFLAAGCARPAVHPAMLLYSDRSPGALPHTLAWQRVAQANGMPAVVVTEPAEFAARLAARPWSHVVVTERYAAEPPPYAAALRKFALANRSVDIDLFLWHDAGTPQPENTAVVATLAHFFWRGGTTAKSYAEAENPGPDTTSARVSEGCLWPDFSGVGVQVPQIIVRPPAGQSVAQVLEGDECLSRCGTTYTSELIKCLAYHALQIEQCRALYGPRGKKGDNPAELAACLGEANADYTNCVNGTINRYAGCTLLCARAAMKER